jgi:MSHA biogenesis protein MshL
MNEVTTRDSNGVPVLGNIPGVGSLFSSKSRSVRKSELVILLKPTVIENDASWRQDILDAKERIDAYERTDRPTGKTKPANSAAPAQ